MYQYYDPLVTGTHGIENGETVFSKFPKTDLARQTCENIFMMYI